MKTARMSFAAISRRALPVTGINAIEALRRLIEGNERFAGGTSVRQPPAHDRLAHLARAEHPFATILGWSDSRVPPELVFDQGPRELFIESQLHLAVEAGRKQGLHGSAPPLNVGWAVHQLASTPVGSDAIARGAIQLVGSVYELHTGRLRFL